MEPHGRFLEYSMESLVSILKAPLGFSTDCPIIPPRLFHRLSQCFKVALCIMQVRQFFKKPYRAVKLAKVQVSQVRWG